MIDIREKILTQPFPISESQKDAVTCDKRYVRVVAGAGAGKTETLTRRIVYLLLCQNVKPKDIVAFTFTEMAAKEMKSRIYLRLKNMGGDDICAKLGEMYVGTIHAFCLNLLQSNFGYENYDVLDENQEMALLMREGFNLGLYKTDIGRNYAEKCKNFLKTVEMVYNELIDEETLKREADEHPIRFYSRLTKYQEILRSYKRLTFGLLIKLAIEKIIEQPNKVPHISHLLVDEYQDINPSQERLILLLGKNSSIFIVGDPRQTIYQWRGSDERCFENFTKHFPMSEMKTITLNENRRSGIDIINVANRFSHSFTTHFSYPDLVPDNKRGKGKVISYKFETNEKEAEWIGKQIQELVRRGKCNYSDIAVILRTVSVSAPTFIDVFRKLEIPFIIGGKAGLFRRNEILAMGLIFSWLHDAGYWFLPGKGKIKGEALLLEGLKKWRDALPARIVLSSTITDDIRNWKKALFEKNEVNFTKEYYSLLEILGYKNLDPDKPLEAVIMANLGRFSNILHDYEMASKIGGRRKSVANDVEGLFWYLYLYAKSAYGEENVEDLQGLNAVFLTTVHQAKGLEWPVVFIPSLIEGIFPLSLDEKKERWFVDKEKEKFKSIINRYVGSIEDERRLFYVALTRARDVLVLSTFKEPKDEDTGVSEFLDSLNISESKSPENELQTAEIIPKGQDPEELQSFEATEITTYLRCPSFYRFRYQWSFRAPISTLMGYGRSLHSAMMHTSELMKEMNINPLSATKTAVNRTFFLPFASKDDNERMKKSAEKALIQFVNTHLNDMGYIENVEVHVEFPTRKAVIGGRVDVILHNENTREIREYKTSDTVTTKEQIDLQLKLYAVGLKKIGYQGVSKASVAYLEENKIDSINLDDSMLSIAESFACDIIDKINTGRFEYCDNASICEKCDYRVICKGAK
ncbi:MAG: ATP-dependent DNA helicase [Thermoplasmata archaeon]